jgi:hypothetical protein
MSKSKLEKLKHQKFDQGIMMELKPPEESVTEALKLLEDGYLEALKKGEIYRKFSIKKWGRSKMSISSN